MLKNIIASVGLRLRRIINIGAVGKNCWVKEQIFIGISGQVDEWQGKDSIINIFSIFKVCEHLDYRLLWADLFI